MLRAPQEGTEPEHLLAGVAEEHKADFSKCTRMPSTSEVIPGALKAAGSQIRLEGKDRWVDNMLVEPLWGSVMYEEVYLRACESVTEARIRIGDYFRFYNSKC